MSKRKFSSLTPKYKKTVKEELANLTRETEKLWNSENDGCPLNFTNMTDSTARLYWLARQTMMKSKRAQEDIENLRLEMNTLLRENSHTSSNLQRHPRAAAALPKLLCFIKSVFGGCDKRVAGNQENLKRAKKYYQCLTDHCTIQCYFYVVSGEMIREAQCKIIETQNRNRVHAYSEPIYRSATGSTSHAQLRTISVCSRANQPTQVSPQ